MRPWTRRIVPAEDIIKATSLNDALGEHAPWCRTAPNALPIHTKPQGVEQGPTPGNGSYFAASKFASPGLACRPPSVG